MRAFLAGLIAVIWGGWAAAQDLSALARFDPNQSRIFANAEEIGIELAISQPVPWRVRLLDHPPRLILDMREVDWTGISGLNLPKTAVRTLRAGVFRAGWSRLVIELAAPHLVETAVMETTGANPVIRLRLRPATPEDFASLAALPEPPEWSLPSPAGVAAPARATGGPTVVVLDPGHGGIDPGAERDGYSEADLMLTFARELKEVLLRDGGFEVVMTREDDVFVPLEARISIARAAGASVFLSLHADALAEGEAVGATLYTLDQEASDAAAQALAERHDRDDLLSGVDLSGQDDVVASVLMDMARTETQPRIERLADTLEASIKGAGLRMHRRPHQKASFSVLKSPDIPSILIELGFLSSARDLKRLIDPAWRSTMALALRDGLKAWVDEEAALSGLRAP